MPHHRVTTLIHLDDGIEQFPHPLAGAAHRRNHRHADHAAERFVIKHGSGIAHLVIHIERNHHRVIHVNQFCGEIHIPFEI